jgi:hypothetical protein
MDGSRIFIATSTGGNFGWTGMVAAEVEQGTPQLSLVKDRERDSR